MQFSIKRALSVMAALLMFSLYQGDAQVLKDSVCEAIMSHFEPRLKCLDSLEVVSTTVSSKYKTVTVTYSRYLHQVPLRDYDIDSIYSITRRYLDKKYSSYKLKIVTDKLPVEHFESALMSGNSAGADACKLSISASDNPLVKNISKAYTPENSVLNGRHIALWQSHGRYYNQGRAEWIWQRCKLFGIVEDTYTQAYVLPYLVPMLENSGASVMLPRERDVQRNEVIVDNDSPTQDGVYYEENGAYAWKDLEGKGFANPQKVYSRGDNPFKMGTTRYCNVCADGDLSVINWKANIPESGEYAVYVSYASKLNSTNEALYTVNHNGGSTTFAVNQQMGGGTWIYLGTFGFEKNSATQGVVLTNQGRSEKFIVTADGVKFGGGVGNVEREPTTHDAKGRARSGFKPAQPTTSGYPKHNEAATYWLQMAGMPDSVYSSSKNLNDYEDDFKSRGLWVNALLKKCNIPIDLAFALHSDASFSKNDSIIGTLAIYREKSENRVKYPSGAPRALARDYADVVQSQVVSDIKRVFEPEWNRREIWNKSYHEARAPEVPTFLLELLSHQNFADMRYGLDPTFQFVVSRAIYKGIARFISFINNVPCIIQPLPVNSFSCNLLDNNEVELQWLPTLDSLESSANPEGYILYTRVMDPDSVEFKSGIPSSGIDGFDNGIFLKDSRTRLTIKPGKIYSFKVTAVNGGGESMPSEILSAGVGTTDRKVLVINNFTRVSAPISFSQDTTLAGFLYEVDRGVPYKRDISHVGMMYEYDRGSEYLSDEAPGFGASYSDMENTIIAGNTFDYPLQHGAAIMSAGCSFASTSVDAVMSDLIDMKDYPVVDIIAGKQIRSVVGRFQGSSSIKYNIFPERLRSRIDEYCYSGQKSIILSGANIASNSWDQRHDYQIDSAMVLNELAPECEFIQRVFRYRWSKRDANRSGIVNSYQGRLWKKQKREYTYFNQPNEQSYFIESPDGIEPVGFLTQTIFRYEDTKSAAGVAYIGRDWHSVSLTFPIETLTTQTQINDLMQYLLKILE